MKKNHYMTALWLLFAGVIQANTGDRIRINQMGYLPQSKKVAVFTSEAGTEVKEYALIDVFTGETKQTFHHPRATGAMERAQATYRLDFSEVTAPGTYYIVAGETHSPHFAINEYLYNGTADFLLSNIREQRCEPDTLPETADCASYASGMADALYRMMLAYSRNPESFGDVVDAGRNPHANGIPDVVDEIRWGLEQLDKISNPQHGMYDKTAGAAGKITACLAFGAEVLKYYDPDFARRIGDKAGKSNSSVRDEFAQDMRDDIQRLHEKAVSNPFMLDFSGGESSNNFTVDALVQCRLYREQTGDNTYREMEASLLGWFFGCNPYGAGLIAGLPFWGESLPSEKTLNAYEQAGLLYYLSALQKEGMTAASMAPDRNLYEHGGIVRTDPSKKQISLIFAANAKADGAELIVKMLKKHNIRGAFFLGGDFFGQHPDIVQRLKADGHYIGAHGCADLLYCSPHKRESTLVGRKEFEKDLLANYRQLHDVGIHYTEAPLFLPPRQSYNYEVAMWVKSLGLQLLAFTPGTMTNADYTTLDMKNYCGSEEIYDLVMEVEQREGLNGHILLVHLGTDDRRGDKFYKSQLERMVKELQKRGYLFVPVKEAVGR